MAVWARDTLGLNTSDYNRKVQTYKNLDWLWDNRHLRKIKQFSQTDTIIIDDSFEKIKQHPNNVIVLPEYDQALHESGRDNALQLITSYLAGLRLSSNVSNYIADQTLQFDVIAKASAVSKSPKIETNTIALHKEDGPSPPSSMVPGNIDSSCEGLVQKYAPSLSKNEKRAIRRSLAKAKAEGVGSQTQT